MPRLLVVVAVVLASPGLAPYQAFAADFRSPAASVSPAARPAASGTQALPVALTAPAYPQTLPVGESVDTAPNGLFDPQHPIVPAAADLEVMSDDGASAAMAQSMDRLLGIETRRVEGAELPGTSSPATPASTGLGAPRPPSEPEKPPKVSRRERLWSWAEQRKGDLTLGASAVFYAASWVVISATSWSHTGNLMRLMGEAALVGGLCDLIALKMIFERRWYLPNSGVLPRNRQKLVDGIAEMIENEWLTPDMIRAKLKEAKLAGQVGRSLEGFTLEGALGREQLAKLCDDAAGLLRSEKFRAMVENIIETNASRPMRMAQSTGLISFSGLSETIVKRLAAEVKALPSNRERVAAIEGHIRGAARQMQRPGTPHHEAVNRLLEQTADQALNAGRGEIVSMVKANLGKLSDDEIRMQIESRTRTHLDWIRVNGGLFGAIFGALFGLLDFALGYGTALLHALLH